MYFGFRQTHFAPRFRCVDRRCRREPTSASAPLLIHAGSYNPDIAAADCYRMSTALDSRDLGASDRIAVAGNADLYRLAFMTPRSELPAGVLPETKAKVY
jgi:hypothetical protein